MYCMQCMYSLRADASQYDIIAISFPHSTSSPTSGGTTGVETVHRTGAHGPRGPIQAHTIRQSQYNTPLLSVNCLFINGPIINNIFLKIMVHSLDFTHKCSQNAGNAISETLNSNIF